MTGIRELAIARLNAVQAGQEVGQPERDALSHPPREERVPWDSSNPQETGKNGQVSRCPTPIDTGQRDSDKKSGTVAGTDGGTVAPRMAKARARLWQANVAHLDPRKPLYGYGPRLWFNLVEASLWWEEHFAGRAALDGWQTGDVFGLIAGETGNGGLIDRIGTSRSLVMEGGRARWRSFGVPMKFNAGSYIHLPPFWEVQQ